MKCARYLLILMLFTLIAGIPGLEWASAKTLEPFAASVTIKNEPIRELPGLFFGHNYWEWPAVWGNQVAGTEDAVRDLNVRLLRFGGIANDAEVPETLSKKAMDQFAAYCQAIGAEPLFQLPVISRKTPEERIARAKEILDYWLGKGYPLHYVSIGNEPDGYAGLSSMPDLSNLGYLRNYSTGDMIKNTISLATAIRRMYPQLKIIGAELSWKYQSGDNDWLTPFMADCAPLIDAVSLHPYPAWPLSAATYDLAHQEYDAAKTFYRSVRQKIDRYAPGMPLIVGETNICAEWDPRKSMSDAPPGSFYAGLWFADFMGVSSAEPGLLSIMPWSISYQSDILGFVEAGTGKRPRPVYFVYQMFSRYCHERVIGCQKIGADIRVYAYADANGDVSVFCINWNKRASCNLEVSFDGLLDGVHYTAQLPPASITCIASNAGMTEKKVYVYTSEDAKKMRGYSESGW